MVNFSLRRVCARAQRTFVGVNRTLLTDRLTTTGTSAVYRLARMPMDPAGEVDPVDLLQKNPCTRCWRDCSPSVTILIGGGLPVF